jgi:4'-phosphopantetheinyl transferase EntD
VASDEERRNLSRLQSHYPDVSWETILFCAKEAVYKAWYPLMRRWLGFQGVHVDLEPDLRAFGATLLDDPLLVGSAEIGELRGRFAVDRDLIVVGLTVP